MKPNSYLNDDVDVYKTCEFCNAPLPKNSTETLCMNCYDRVLFLEVKEFIRENDVNEFQVAEHFGLPLRVIKNWINEGRIQYKEDASGQHIIANSRCVVCGAPVTFGTRCSKCQKKSNKNIQGFSGQLPTVDDKMRFLHDED